MCAPFCVDPTHVCLDCTLCLVRVSVCLGSSLLLFFSFPDARLSRADRRTVQGGVVAFFRCMGGGRGPLSCACGRGVGLFFIVSRQQESADTRSASGVPGHLAGRAQYPSWEAGGGGTLLLGVCTCSWVDSQPACCGRKRSAAVLGTFVRVETSDGWVQGGVGGRLVVCPARDVRLRPDLVSRGNERGFTASGVRVGKLGWKKGRGSRLLSLM